MVYLPHMPASAGADVPSAQPKAEHIPGSSFHDLSMPATADAASPFPYRPAGVLVNVLTVMFALYIFVTGAVLFTDWQTMSMLQSVSNGADVTVAQMFTAEMMQGVATLVGLCLYIPLVVVFCMWIYRASCNARALAGEELSVSPGWTVGWFFIPIMHLFKPYLATKEIWQASQPGAGADWRSVPASAIVHAWWALWIGSQVVGNVSVRMTWGGTESIDSHLLASQIGVAADVLTIAAGLCALLVVRGIHERQQAKCRASMGEPLFAAPGQAQHAA